MLQCAVKIAGIVLVLGMCLMIPEGIGGGNSDLLIVKPMAGDLMAVTGPGSDPKLDGLDGSVVVVGRLDMPYFAVEDAKQVAVYDADGKPVPLWVETSSLYSEFDDGTINMMQIAFTMPEASIERGPLRLSWGDSVASESRMVDQIPLYLQSKDRYRTFECEAQPRGNDAANFSSSVVVIVDDKADIYFLWYLLPMVLIFVLLFVRKAVSR